MAKKVKKTAKVKTSAKAKAKKSKAKKTVAKKSKVKKATAKKATAKKAATKKVAAGKKTFRKRRKSVLKPEEIEKFRQMLLRKWAEIVGDVNSIENEALKKSRLDAAGDLSSMPIHMADIGTDNFEQEFALGLMDSERKLLVEIRDALKRIDDGVYGICKGTGKPIAKARLNANPWARYCIEYANMVEKGLVEEGQSIYDEALEEEEFEDIDYDDETEDKPKKVSLDELDENEDDDENKELN